MLNAGFSLVHCGIATSCIFSMWTLLPPLADLNVMQAEGDQHHMKDDSAQILLSNKKTGVASLIKISGCWSIKGHHTVSVSRPQISCKAKPTLHCLQSCKTAGAFILTLWIIYLLLTKAEVATFLPSLPTFTQQSLTQKPWVWNLIQRAEIAIWWL